LFAGGGHVIVPAKEGRAITVAKLPPLDRDTARERLQDLMTDFGNALRGIGHLDDVPLDEIAAVLKDHDQQADAVKDWADELLDRRGDDEEQGHARYTRDQRRRRAVAPEVPENIGMLVRRRAVPYLEWKAALAESQTTLDANDPGSGTDDEEAT
jgi:hypothetical protein